jgi:hypothetical protein
MTVTLDLSPELEEQVVAQARAAGVTMEAYLLSLIRAGVVLPARGEQATQEEFEGFLDALAEDSDDIPVLPPEALTREAIYGDHD